MRSLVTDRLRLEPQCREHAERMFRVLSDPAIYEHENEPPPSVEWLRERFERLETRHSPDGSERWLNWVIARATGELIGFVQATVHASGRAAIAYELHSAHWHQGLAGEAVRAMLEELRMAYGVQMHSAVLKSTNRRSRRLLERLGFEPMDPATLPSIEAGADELLMVRRAVLDDARQGADPSDDRSPAPIMQRTHGSPNEGNRAMGSVEHIFIAEAEGSPMITLPQVAAIADRGLAGDRNAKPSAADHPGTQLTLIEAEHIEAWNASGAAALQPHEPRRNLVTRGVRLNDLVGQRFRVGEVEAEGIMLCEPCGTFEKRTHAGIVRGFTHKGGLRARILRGGLIRVGDSVTAL